MVAQCFVIGVIGVPGSTQRNHADWVLEYVIRPVFNQHFPDVLLERSDKITAPGMIDSQIINRLHEADLVIADLTLLNPNVFYEIGIRHMIEKPTIHIYLEGTEIPFDVKPYRAIPFKLTHPEDIEKAKNELLAAVKTTREDGYVTENPVTRARGHLKLQQHATPEQRVLVDQIDALSERLTAVEIEQRASALAKNIRNAFLRQVSKLEDTPGQPNFARQLYDIANPLSPPGSSGGILKNIEEIREHGPKTGEE